MVVLHALQQTLVHAQKQEPMPLRAEEIDRVQRARHAVERDEFLIRADPVERVEYFERRRAQLMGDGLKAEFIAEPVDALRPRSERLRERMHADVEDRLIGAGECACRRIVRARCRCARPVPSRGARSETDARRRGQ